ncbi:MAG: ATP-binding protein [Campylobacterota bacterium]
MTKYSLSNKLLLILFIAMFIVFAVRVPINYYNTKNNYMEELQSKTKLLEQRLKLAVSSPVWNLYYDVVEDIIKIEVQDPYIASIVVNDIDGMLIAKAVHNGEISTNMHKEVFDVHFMSEHIANIEVLYDKQVIESRLFGNLLNQFTQFIMVLLFVLIVFKIAIDRSVIKNLKTLKRLISHVRKTKQYDTKIELDTNDEFKVLAHEFNEMQDAVLKSIHDLEKLNNELEIRIQEEVEKSSKREKELYDKARFIQMGEMISNIAHHWRQPLSAISSTASSLRLQKQIGTLDDEELINSLNIIMSQTQKLSSTIDDFRTFFIEEHTDKKIYFDLKETIEKLESIIYVLLVEKSIELTLTLEDGITIYGYQNELFQVILNLVNNAVEAFEDKKDIFNKEIHIESFRADDKIFINVEDNAGGIPDEYIERIFDPYFTTKHKKQGVGVSLYMCKEIVYKHHNGDINVINTKNGAKFTITIPTI